MISLDPTASVPSAADAVVVGAGAMGLSVAYHLALAGQRVVLLDKGSVAGQNSRRAAGLFAQMLSTETMTRLSHRAMTLVKKWSATDGIDLPLVMSGSIKIARRPEHVQQLDDDLAASAGRGVDMHAISAIEARRLLPYLEPVGITGITYTPDDLDLEPEHLIATYVALLATQDVTILEHTAATGIGCTGGAVASVETARGVIETSVVVDAGGAWVHGIGRFGDAPIAAVPTRHQLFITEPLADVEPLQPIARVIDANVYVRPASGGLMLGGYEADPLMLPADEPRANFSMSELVLDRGVLQRLAALVEEQFPIFRTAPIAIHRGGLPTMTADGELIVGPHPALLGLYVAGGCCVSGLSVSPAIGEVLAAWIVHGDPGIDIALLAPGRAAARMRYDSSAIAASRRQYAYRYWSEESRPVQFRSATV